MKIRKLFMLLGLLLLPALFNSCQHPLGYSVLLWDLPEHNLQDGHEDVLKKGGDAKPGSGDADSGEGDALTMFNHMASRDCEGHFVVVPFDFEFSRNQKKTLGNGVFRLILDFKKKNVLKSVINFNIIGKIWNFVIDFMLILMIS